MSTVIKSPDLYYDGVIQVVYQDGDVTKQNFMTRKQRNNRTTFTYE